MKGEEQLTDAEREGPNVVYLEDGRRFEVPAVVYDHIRSAGFRHGIAWADAHPKADRIDWTVSNRGD